VEHLLQTISTLLDLFYSKAVGPLFTLIGNGLDAVLLQPLQILHVPSPLQVVIIAILTGFLSIAIRSLMRVEEKDEAFRKKFAQGRESREELSLISDWKSRETFARVIDQDIDQDFNTYLAERFARHGIIYLLPIFLVLFWLQKALGSSGILFSLPDNSFGIQGIHVPFVFLLTYCVFLFVFFRRRRKMRR
jgi:uncharacterized membrane protein (DUF106 family)